MNARKETVKCFDQWESHLLLLIHILFSAWFYVKQIKGYKTSRILTDRQNLNVSWF